MNKSQKTALPKSAKKKLLAVDEERDKKQWWQMDQEREPVCYPANEHNENEKGGKIDETETNTIQT